MLNTIIDTNYVKLRLATIDDITILKKIYDEAMTCYAFDPGYEITSPEVILRKGALPLDSTIGESLIYCICDDKRIIGYTELYPGFPTKDNVYISLFYITEANTNKTMSEDVLLHLLEEFTNNSFKTISVSTSLKTWHDLAFWQGCGFDTILSVEADPALIHSSYGRVELQYIV